VPDLEDRQGQRSTRTRYLEDTPKPRLELPRGLHWLVIGEDTSGWDSPNKCPANQGHYKIIGTSVEQMLPIPPSSPHLHTLAINLYIVSITCRAIRNRTSTTQHGSQTQAILWRSLPVE
jgi:hypothetical protein